MQPNTVGIIGAGNIGTSVASTLLLHNIKTILVDISDRQLENARKEIVQTIKYAPLLNKQLPKVAVEVAMQNARFTSDLSEIQHCDFVIENVPEEWAIKEKVYHQLDKICDPGTSFGINTSCISITQAGGAINRPDKVIGVHFMNPVYLMPTVEVIRGTHTSDETLATLHNLLARIKKDSIVVNDFPGFVSNRISHLFMNEAAFVVQDQVADPKQVDAIFRQCFGHRMGPLETADLIGLDTVMKSIDTLYENYKDPKFRCCPLIKKKVFAGYLGRKTGKGFYDYVNV
jgi:3-hydroxybutyryl-CoA dehydrogenase